MRERTSSLKRDRTRALFELLLATRAEGGGALEDEDEGEGDGTGEATPGPEVGLAIRDGLDTCGGLATIIINTVSIHILTRKN